MCYNFSFFYKIWVSLMLVEYNWNAVYLPTTINIKV